MPPKKETNASRLTTELTNALASKVVSTTKDLASAMKTITADMLRNNPYVPPTSGCPINEKLPNELLAHIFLVGAMSDGDDDDDEEDEDAIDEDGSMFQVDGDSDDDSDDDEKDQRSPKPVKSSNEDREMTGSEPDAEGSLSFTDQDALEEEELPFQVLVSHVCRHWRSVAIESPILWTMLTFTEGAPFEKSKVYVARSKNLPLDIIIDATEPGDDESDSEEQDFHVGVDDTGEVTTIGIIPGALPTEDETVAGANTTSEKAKDIPLFSREDIAAILDIIVPEVSRWRTLEIMVNDFEYMHMALVQMAKCTIGAPLLEVLQLYHYEDAEEYEEFQPVQFKSPMVLFGGLAPKLSHVALWGVHLDWELSGGQPDILANLRDLEFTYHAADVRPTYASFKRILMSSPELETLSLSLSGPAGSPADWPSLEMDAEAAKIDLPSVTSLVLCYHDPLYVTALLPRISLPNLTDLAVDYDEEDYSDLVRILAAPRPVGTSSRSLLAGLHSLKIGGLPCDRRSIDVVYEQLGELTGLNLNCGYLEEAWFEALSKPISSPAAPTPSTNDPVIPRYYCPLLKTITTTGVSGATMRSFIEARRNAGLPIKSVFMSEEDQIDEKEEKWLRSHVDTLEFFEPSDEEEVVDVMDIDSEDDSD